MVNKSLTVSESAKLCLGRRARCGQVADVEDVMQVWRISLKLTSTKVLREVLRLGDEVRLKDSQNFDEQIAG